MRLIFLGAILIISGCSGSPQNFWRAVVRTTCKYNRDCTRVDVPHTLGECADEVYAEGIDPEAFAAMCEDYDPQIGQACLAYVREPREVCAEFSEGPEQCNDICGPGTAIFFEYRPAEGGMLATPVPFFGSVGGE